jgi:hypothetical protein
VHVRAHVQQARNKNLSCWTFHKFCDSSFIGFYSPILDLRFFLFFGSLIYFYIWYDSLDEWSAHHKAPAYTGQHNTERWGQTSMP